MNSAQLEKQIRQFLVHSFLYYQLNETIISDQEYDKLCLALKENIETHPQGSEAYLPLAQQALGSEASGFFIKKYPPAIISSALHLIYQHQHSDKLSFSDFLTRKGYRLESDSAVQTKDSSRESN